MADDAVAGWRLDPATRRKLALDEAERALIERNPEVAIVALEEQLSSQPDDDVALSLLCTALFAAGEHPVSREALRTWLERNPDDVNRWAHLAITELELCNLDASVQAAQRALGLVPSHGEAQFVLGIALQQLGQTSEASAAFAKAHLANPLAYPLPMPLSHAQGEQLVAQAFTTLPEPVTEIWANARIEFKPFPDLEELRKHTPPLSPRRPVLYHLDAPGTDLLDFTMPEHPDALVVFLGNLAHAPDQESAVELLAEAILLETESWMDLKTEL